MMDEKNNRKLSDSELEQVSGGYRNGRRCKYCHTINPKVNITCWNCGKKL